MKPRDIALAVLVSAIWGFGFAVAPFGLQSFSAPQLTAIRVLIAALPVLFLPRPPISISLLITAGTFLFTGQFLLLFYAYTLGMPPGVASFTQQTQVFFTVLLAAIFLREIPALHQIVGMVIALAGIIVIAQSAGTDMTFLGLELALGAALSWGIGNVLVKSAGALPMFAPAPWMSLATPLPALAMSIWFNHDPPLTTSLMNASWVSLGAAVYFGAIATTLAYGAWGYLLGRYSAATVTPYALIAPCVGTASSALLLGERFPLPRYGGMALILVGVAITVLPLRLRFAR